MTNDGPTVDETLKIKDFWLRRRDDMSMFALIARADNGRVYELQFLRSTVKPLAAAFDRLYTATLNDPPGPSKKKSPPVAD
jgi:hypothetical protein